MSAAWLEWLRSWERTVLWESTWCLTAPPSADGECVRAHTDVLMNFHTRAQQYILFCKGFSDFFILFIHCQTHNHVEKIKLKEEKVQCHGRFVWHLSSRQGFPKQSCLDFSVFPLTVTYPTVLNSALISWFIFLFFPLVTSCLLHPFPSFTMFTFSSLTWVYLIAAELTWPIDIELLTMFTVCNCNIFPHLYSVHITFLSFFGPPCPCLNIHLCTQAL